jgi:hypothetical protein
MIISLPVQTAVCPYLGEGAPTFEVGAHAPVTGLYRAPELRLVGPTAAPPQTIISLPVQTAE